MFERFLNYIGAKLIDNGRAQSLTGSKDLIGAYRYFLMWSDEYLNPLTLKREGGHPWWFPFNMYLHRWLRSDTGLPHNHTRWNISIVLKGELWEVVNRKKLRILRPGSIVFRGPNYYHTVFIPPHLAGRTWTLFIVGRRRTVQNYMLQDGSIVPAVVYEASKGKAFSYSGYGAECSLAQADSEPQNTNNSPRIEDALKQAESENLKLQGIPLDYR